MAVEVISPRIRGFICTSAHPAGCAANVREQIEVARAGRQREPRGGAALVIGASTGYGLASRIAAAFGHGMSTLGVFLERGASDKRTGTAGWYNSAAFHEAARAEGLLAESLCANAFAESVKEEAIAGIRRAGRKLDLVVYSLAAPARTLDTGETIRSALKPIGQSFTAKSIDVEKEAITQATLEPATDEEIAGTIAVMGGDDLRQWVGMLLDAEVLAPGARVVAYSYIGPEVTWAIYRSGTIGRAKEDLEQATRDLDRTLQDALGGNAWVSVNKAVVTQASAAIPVVPLYISILYRVMEEKGLHERPIEQMVRLFNTHLTPGVTPVLDPEGRIRMDDWEMREDVQAEVTRRWREVSTENLHQLADFAGYRREFRRLFGFEVEGVDYTQPVETDVAL